VYRVCRRITGNDADAGDAAQEALISMARGLPRFDGRSRLSTWTYRIAVNAALDEVRRRSRRGEPLGDVDDIVGLGQIDETVAARIDVDEAVRNLPPEFRSAVVLRDLCGLDYAEIAEVLAIPAGTVRSRISRGRSMLADHLHSVRTEK
jgi:RNA polymerase sigma-70 factor (ECF subfamily)